VKFSARKIAIGGVDNDFWNAPSMREAGWDLEGVARPRLRCARSGYPALTAKTSRSADEDQNHRENTSMALVSYVTNQNAAEKVKPVFEGMEKKLGVVPNVFRAMAHNPEMLEAFLGLNATLPKTKLDGKLRELAYIKTSELNGCDYCLHHHRALGKKAGLNDRQVAETAQLETSDAYDDLQREVMRFAEEVTRHINVDDKLVALLKQRLGDRELVELAMTVGIANFTNRVTETLRLELP
jgi:uncharacterized peroxidase-related enzyme